MADLQLEQPTSHWPHEAASVSPVAKKPVMQWAHTVRLSQTMQLSMSELHSLQLPLSRWYSNSHTKHTVPVH